MAKARAAREASILSFTTALQKPVGDVMDTMSMLYSLCFITGKLLSFYRKIKYASCNFGKKKVEDTKEAVAVF